MRFETFKPSKGITIISLDLLAIFGTLFLVFSYTEQLSPGYRSTEFWLLPITHVAVHALAGTYNQNFLTAGPRLPTRTLWITITSGLLYLFLHQTLKFTLLSPFLTITNILLSVAIIGVLSTMIRVFVNKYSVPSRVPIEWLYLGYSSSAKIFLEDAHDINPNQSIVVSTSQKNISLGSNGVLNHQALIELATNNYFSTIIIDPSFSPSDRESRELVRQKMTGVDVFQLDQLYESTWFQINIDSDRKHSLLFLGDANSQSKPSSMRLKRTLDVLLSVILLLIFIPILGLIALSIRFTSKDPIFFSQTRVGLNSVPFKIYKFRTMIVDAEKKGAKWAKTNDPRSTRLGQLLRSSRLDELPQLWNVLQGSMSLVGPRPERPEFMDQLRENISYYDFRHLSKPGITGWAQISFPYGASLRDSRKKLQYDLYYIKHQSFKLDIIILMKTISIMFRFEGR